MGEEVFSGFGEKSFTIPSGTNEVTIEVQGAAGGGGEDGEKSGGEGGDGALVRARFPGASSGDVIDMSIGGGGSSGEGFAGNGGYNGGGDGGSNNQGINGGGGGGYTRVEIDGTFAIAVGGGGGGGPDSGIGIPGSKGGPGVATTTGSTLSAGADGNAGGGGGWTGGDAGTTPNAGGDGGGSNVGASFSSVTLEQTDGGGVQGDSGDGGDAVVTITYPEPPAAPDNPAQSVTADDSIDVSWSEDTSQGEASIYRLQVSEDGGAWSTAATPTGTSYTYSADPTTNSHRFRVRAENSLGNSGWSYTETVSTDPTALTVTGHDATSVSLSWDGVRDATGYVVFRAKSSGSSVGDYSIAATTGATTATDGSLENGEQYYYRVQAEYSGSNSQLSNEVVQTTDLPATNFDTVEET